MVLYVHQKGYMRNGQSKQAGARVVVHSSEFPSVSDDDWRFRALPVPGSQIPLVDEYGIDLRPNTLSQLAIQETVMQRIEKPYTSMCIRSWHDSAYSVVAEHQPYLPYSMAVKVMLQCKQSERCFCDQILN